MATCMLLAMTGFSSSLIQSSAYVRRQAEVLDVKRGLQLAFASETFCRCNMPNITFDSAAIPSSIPLSDLRIYPFVSGAPCNSGSLSWLAPQTRLNSLMVKSIYWKNIKLISAGRYQASLNIDVSSEGVPMRPISVDGVVLLTSSAGGSMLKIDGCRADGEMIYLGVTMFTQPGPRNAATEHLMSYTAAGTDTRESSQSLATFPDVSFVLTK